MKNVIEKVLPIFKSNSSPEDDITKKLKFEAVELISHAAYKNVVVLTQCLGEVLHSLTY